MSKVTLQELSDLLGVYVAVDEDMAVCLYDDKPEIDGNHWANSTDFCGTRLGNCIFLTNDKNIQIDSNLNWKESLATPQEQGDK